MSQTSNRIAVSLDNISIGDIVYLSTKEDAIPYQVLDKGTPFILIENVRSHFANLFRPTKELYKELTTIKNE